MDYLTKSIIGTSIIFLFAILSYFNTPKSIGAFGYKTPRSMKNEVTWLYANSLANKLFITVVVAFIVIQVLLYSYFYSNNYYLAYSYSFTIFTILSILVIPIVEIKLYIKFDRKGNFRNK